MAHLFTSCYCLLAAGNETALQLPTDGVMTGALTTTDFSWTEDI